ncbi:hypothetical protein ACERNI_10825 [Camelimonas sp. ID_303_24]
MPSRTFVVPAASPGYRWPATLPPITCPAILGGVPPIPLDRLSAPTGDVLLPQVIAVAPRGRAWQTDETSGPVGATVQHKLWAVVADAVAGAYATLTRAVGAAFPSAADEGGIASWEYDYGLPDPCLGQTPGLEARRQAVRGALVSADDASIQAMVCAAAAIGYDIQIEEWDAFECGWTGFGEAGFGSPDLAFEFLVIAPNLPLTWIAFGEIGFGNEGFGSFPPDGLVCLIQHIKHSHTWAHYSIEGIMA